MVKELALVNPNDFVLVLALALIVVLVGLISWKLDMGYVVIAMSSVIFIGFVVVMMAFHFGSQPRLFIAETSDITTQAEGYRVIGERADGTHVLEWVPQEEAVDN